MPPLNRSSSARSKGGWRPAVAGATRVLAPRGVFTVHRVDGALFFAVRAALAMGVVALPVAQAGRPDLAVYAMLGSFTTTFGRNLPYPRRARVLALVAVAMTASVGCGSAFAVWARPWEGGAGEIAVVAGTALVAGLSKFACDAARLSGLGAVLLLFSFAVAANSPAAWSEVPVQTGLAAAGAAAAWVFGVSGWLVHPDRPQRFAVANALQELAVLLEATAAGGGVQQVRQVRQRTTVAVLQAYHSLGLRPPTEPRQADRTGLFVRLTDLSWALLIGSGHDSPRHLLDTAHHLRRQARLLTRRRRKLPPLLTELPFLHQEHRGSTDPLHPSQAARVTHRAADLLVGRYHGEPHRKAAVLAVPALRMVLGTGAAGGLAAALDLEHGYWASVSAAAVLHSVNLRTTVERAVQRTLGTLVGLLIALGVLAVDLAPVTLALVVVLLEFLLEYYVARNYGLGVVFLTPLALLLSDLAAPAPAGQLVYARVVGSVDGIVVGLLCALLVVHGHSAVRAARALAACTEAAAAAERWLADRSGPGLPTVQLRLVAAVVELREADDAAAGELWPAGVDPTELAAAEQHAYALLERLHVAR
ncbi:FUSC family protein [Streptomyces sp. Da 82-17]|uniref:FUSC family protein n=1 Tax=Streptomyces sp. Da 82-17 TaxID=3377116 RepID=UPI0038D35508